MPSAELILEKFTRALGTSSVSSLADGGSERISIRPGSEDEVITAVRLAGELGSAIEIRGGGTHARGSPESGPPILLDLTRLDHIVEHAAGDLTVTAEAGLTLARLETPLRAHGQRLPISAAWPERCTLGGAVARAAEGPTRTRDGSLRDQILGVRIVHGDGRASATGGRVVKNVTGYDLARLYTGSWGSLGVITQLTVRLRAVESRCALLVRSFPDLDAAWHTGFDLLRAHPDIAAAHVVSGGALPDLGSGEVRLLITLAGGPELVDALEREIPADDKIDCDPRSRLQTPFPGAATRLCIQGLPGDAYAAAEESWRHVPAAPAFLDIGAGALQIAFDGPWPLDLAAEEDFGQALKPFSVLVDVAGDRSFPRRRYRSFPSSEPDGRDLARELTRALDPLGILNRGLVEFSWTAENDPA